jgi:hypothetical protein
MGHIILKGSSSIKRDKSINIFKIHFSDKPEFKFYHYLKVKIGIFKRFNFDTFLILT